MAACIFHKYLAITKFEDNQESPSFTWPLSVLILLCELAVLYESYSTASTVLRAVQMKNVSYNRDSMYCMSNKALGVGSRGTIQHSALPQAVWAF